MNIAPLISVVVPIYNVSGYLEACIDSILSQSYRQLEVILVDDESPDDCPQICDRYAKKDERVKVIHKKNGGLSDARNAGIKAASGEYIAFVDGDDYIASEFIQKLYNTLTKEVADISCCSFYRVYGKKSVAPFKSAEAKTFTNNEALRDIFTGSSLCEVMTWNKLYKISLFKDNNICFPIGKVHEDNFTTYKLFYFANKIAFINDPLYYYIQRGDSIMGRKFDSRRLHALEAVEEARKFVQRHNLELNHELESYEGLVSLGLTTDYVLSESSDKEIASILKIQLKGVHHFVKNPLVGRKHKLMFMLARLGLGPYRAARIIFEMSRRHK